MLNYHIHPYLVSKKRTENNNIEKGIVLQTQFYKYLKEQERQVIKKNIKAKLSLWSTKLSIYPELAYFYKF